MTNNQLSVQNRISWIDAAKGITAVLVVLGHVLNLGKVQAFVSVFHVPTFFLLSGICFSHREKFISFFSKKFRQIMIPYYIWGLIAIFVYLVGGHLITEKEILSLKECLFGLISGTAKSEYMQFNLHLWFLPVLFVMQILFYPIAKASNRIAPTKQPAFFITVSLILTAVSIILIQSELNIVLPFGIETSVKLLPFFSFGYLLKFTALYKNIELKSKKAKILLAISAIFSFALLLIFSLWHFELFKDKINYFRNAFGNLPIFICAAVCGIVFTVLLAQFLSKCELIKYIGKKSLTMLLMQKFPILLFTDVIPFTAKYIAVNNFFAVTAVTVASVALCIAADYVIANFLPFLYGKKYIKQTENLK